MKVDAGKVGRQMLLKRNLLILSERIFDSRVDAGILSWAAAPDGPETRPPVAANAASIASLSCAGDFWAIGPPPCRGEEDPTESQLGSTEKTSVSQTMTDRSMTFCSSRMFPGQAYDSNSSRVLFSMVPIFFPDFREKRWMKYSISLGMSSLRSRRGGVSIGNTFKR